MSTAVVLWLALVLSASAALTLTIVLAAASLRLDARFSERLGMAIVPPWGALALWRSGRHVLPALWAISIAVYVALRASASLIV